MYHFISKCWNPLKGECLHRCPYCYVPHTRAAKLYTGAPRLDEGALKQNLGTGGFVFVSNMNDLFGEWVMYDWIQAVLARCWNADNWYLFQTKNPGRFVSRANRFPPKTVLATTLECFNRDDLLRVPKRVTSFALLKQLVSCVRMVTIEPIMDFNPKGMRDVLEAMSPHVVAIGADSKGHNLPEPSAEKVVDLIRWIEGQGIKIVAKSNLARILKEKSGH